MAARGARAAGGEAADHRVLGLGNARDPKPSRRWLKFKNPVAPAVKREAEEEWGR